MKTTKAALRRHLSRFFSPLSLPSPLLRLAFAVLASALAPGPLEGGVYYLSPPDYTDFGGTPQNNDVNHPIRYTTGTSWTTPTGSPRAFVMDIHSSDWTDWWATWSTMLNLNDPHLTYMPSGWVLSTAEAINDLGWIVGNGSYCGFSRAFLLVPQDVLLHDNDAQ